MLDDWWKANRLEVYVAAVMLAMVALGFGVAWLVRRWRR